MISSNGCVRSCASEVLLLGRLPCGRFAEPSRQALVDVIRARGRGTRLGHAPLRARRAEEPHGPLHPHHRPHPRQNEDWVGQRRLQHVPPRPDGRQTRTRLTTTPAACTQTSQKHPARDCEGGADKPGSLGCMLLKPRRNHPAQQQNRPSSNRPCALGAPFADERQKCDCRGCEHGFNKRSGIVFNRLQYRPT